MSDEENNGSEEDPKNTARVEFDEASGDGEVHVEHREGKPVHVAIVMDATSSREMSIENAKIDFRSQMQRLKESVEEASSLKNLRISLSSFGAYGPILHGMSENPEDIADMFDAVCVSSAPTQICSTLEMLRDCQTQDFIEPVDAAIVIGDTVDSGRRQDIKNNPDFFTDTISNLSMTGRNFGAPIITLLDETDFRDGVGTHPMFDHEAMKVLSEASGVKDCPLDHDADITFVDYVIATAAIRIGPEAVQEVKDKGLINEKVWTQFSEKTVETIHEPTPPEVIYVDREVYIQPKASKSRWVMYGLGLLTGAALCALSHCHGPENDAVLVLPPEPKDPLVVSPDDKEPDLRDRFRDENRITFDDVNSPVNFRAGSTVITPEFAEVLDRIGALLEENPDEFTSLTIEGHASTPGSDLANMALSKQRAEIVVKYLNDGFNIEIPLIGFGCGERDLAIDPETTLEDRNTNRRVVFEPDAEKYDAIDRDCETIMNLNP